jgi:hypothetical protein
MRGICLRVILSGYNVFEQLSSGHEIEDEVMVPFLLDVVVQSNWKEKVSDWMLKDIL